MTTRPNWMFRLWLPCALLVCLVGCPRRTPPGPGPSGGGGSPNVTDAAVDDDAEGIDTAATESEVTDAEAGLIAVRFVDEPHHRRVGAHVDPSLRVLLREQVHRT